MSQKKKSALADGAHFIRQWVENPRLIGAVCAALIAASGSPLAAAGPDARPNIVMVKARESKEQRAAPVAQAYRAGKVQHLQALRDGALEAQMTSWVPGVTPKSESPDRVDSLVWGVRHLLFGDGVVGGGRQTAKTRNSLSSWR